MLCSEDPQHWTARLPATFLASSERFPMMTTPIRATVVLTLLVSLAFQTRLCTAQYLNLISYHNGSTSSTGVVTRSGVFSSTYEAWNAFSDRPGMWLSKVFENPAWIQYSFMGRTRRVHGYKFHFANGGRLTTRAPKKFFLQVERGGVWEPVDYRCCETNWAGSENRTYWLRQNVAGNHFRFLFIDDNDARKGIVVISLARITLIGRVLWKDFLFIKGPRKELRPLDNDPAGHELVKQCDLMRTC